MADQEKVSRKKLKPKKLISPRHDQIELEEKEEPYIKNKKLNPCQKSPLTLYELTAKVVDQLPLPEAFNWTVEDVEEWVDVEVGLPECKASFRENYINGMRLLMLEDPSNLAAINIKKLSHIQMVNTKIHQLFGTEIIKFTRSIGLPPRKPLTHCTFFKSRTGPSWGVRKNWTRYFFNFTLYPEYKTLGNLRHCVLGGETHLTLRFVFLPEGNMRMIYLILWKLNLQPSRLYLDTVPICDILRWMKIIMPEPLHLDHWDLVWYFFLFVVPYFRHITKDEYCKISLSFFSTLRYQKPDFPKVKFARIDKKPIKYEYIPHYTPTIDVCKEIMIPRKFKIQQSIPHDAQYIWIENIEEPQEKKEKKKKIVPKKSRLVPQKISLTGLRGKEFILAKRKMCKPKFLP